MKEFALVVKKGLRDQPSLIPMMPMTITQIARAFAMVKRSFKKMTPARTPRTTANSRTATI
jgi:hypothetical protein